MGISLNEQRRLRFSLHNFFKLVAPLFGSNHQLAKRIEYLGQIWRDPAKRHRRDTLIHAGRRLHTDYLWLFRTQFSSKVWNSKLDRFSEELRKLLGYGKGQILGSAPILEEAIAERLCAKLGLKTQPRLSMAFSVFIRKLKEDYCSKGKEVTVSVIAHVAKPEEAKMRS